MEFHPENTVDHDPSDLSQMITKGTNIRDAVATDRHTEANHEGVDDEADEDKRLTVHNHVLNEEETVLKDKLLLIIANTENLPNPKALK